MLHLVRSSIKFIEIEEEIINSAPFFNLVSKGKELCSKKDIEHAIIQSAHIGAERFIIQENDENIGIIEYLLNNPGDQSTWLGLLLIKGDLQSQGYGSKVLKQFETLMISKGIATYRIQVIHNNDPAHKFWINQGFNRIGSVIDSDNKEQIIYEKILMWN